LEDKIYPPIAADNRAIAHVPGNAHTLVQRAAVQRREFRNRVVVRLALCESNVGKRNEGNYDNRRAHQELPARLHSVLPSCKSLEFRCNSSTALGALKENPPEGLNYSVERADRRGNSTSGQVGKRFLDSIAKRR